MNQERTKKSGRILLVWVAILLLIGSGYCWYRARVKHDQNPLDVESPVHLTSGSALNIPLSIPVTRPCQAELQYPKSASPHVSKDLQNLTGAATLTKGGNTIAQAVMPTYVISGYPDVAGTTLFRFKSEEGQYMISLKIDYAPPGLNNVEGKLRIQDDFFHYKDVIGLTILSEVLGVFAILIIIPVTYFWLRNRRPRT